MFSWSYSAFFPFALRDAVISWSVGTNRALSYPCFSIYIADLHACTIYILDEHACMIYVRELKIKLLKSKFECCPVFQL